MHGPTKLFLFHFGQGSDIVKICVYAGIKYMGSPLVSLFLISKMEINNIFLTRKYFEVLR